MKNKEKYLRSREFDCVLISVIHKKIEYYKKGVTNILLMFA